MQLDSYYCRVAACRWIWKTEPIKILKTLLSMCTIDIHSPYRCRAILKFSWNEQSSPGLTLRPLPIRLLSHFTASFVLSVLSNNRKKKKKKRIVQEGNLFLMFPSRITTTAAPSPSHQKIILPPPPCTHSSSPASSSLHKEHA